MADTAASILAPNAPDWTPPATTQTPVNATATPTETTPPVTVNSGDPTQVAPVPMGQPMLQPDTTPTYNQPTVLPDHEAWWHRALNEVGTLMGGNQTIRLTKTPDGTMTVQRDPSTMGEKWGRVAAAMLGGAAQGLANGQGPGGPARAAAAGVQFGMQMPQQQLAAANAQAEGMNKQQLAAANIALLHQRMVTEGLQSQSMGLTLAGQQAELFNRIAQATKDSPNATVLPTVDNMPDMAKLPTSYANALAAHANGQMVMNVTPMPNGKVGWTPVITDTAYQDRLNDKPREQLELGVDPTTHQPILKSHMVDALTHPNKVIDQGNQGVTVQYLTQNNAWMKANAEANKPPPAPTSPQQAQAMANLATDPTRQAALQKSVPQMQQLEINQRIASREPAPGTAEGYQAIAADLNSPRPLVDISQLRTRKDWPQMYGAARQYAIDHNLPAFDPATASARYKARTDTIRAYTGDGDASQKIQGFSTLLEHLGDMSDNADELRRTNSPFLNKPINELDQAIAGGTRVGPAELRTVAPAHEFANVLSNNRALNNDEKAQAAKTLNVNMTPAQLQANAKQMARTSIERLAPVFQAFREASYGDESPTQLTPRAMQTLRNMGLGDYAMQEMHGQATAAASTNPTPNTSQAARVPQNVVPAGATPGRDPQGNIIGYRKPDGSVVRF